MPAARAAIALNIMAAILMCMSSAAGSSVQPQQQPARRAIGAATRRLQQRRAAAAAAALAVCAEPVPGIPLGWQPPGNSKRLALTFDDGPHARSLASVLDVLRGHGVRATFFVNTYVESEWLGPFTSAANQGVLRRALADGHELGSHAAEHVRLPTLPAAAVDEQLRWAAGNISRVTGSRSVPLFRAPYGAGFMGPQLARPDAALRRLWAAVRQQHVHVAWSFSAEDYTLGARPDCVEKLFAAYQHASGVVLLHSTPNGIGGCPAALDKLLRFWAASGVRFTTVRDLVRERYGGWSPEEVVRQARACRP